MHNSALEICGTKLELPKYKTDLRLNYESHRTGSRLEVKNCNGLGHAGLEKENETSLNCKSPTQYQLNSAPHLYLRLQRAREEP